MNSIFFKRFIIVVVITTIILSINVLTGGILQRTLYNIVAVPIGPFQLRVKSVSDYLSAFGDIENLVNKNRELQKIIKEQQGIQSINDELQRENISLNKQLAIATDQKKLIKVNIIAIESSSISSSLIVNIKGAEAQQELPVIAHGNILVGVVDSITGNTARVIVVDDPRTTMSVRISGTDIIAKVTGAGGGKVTVNLITAKEALKKGDRIVTSGLDGLPKGLVVGTINDVQYVDGALFQDVEADILFQPYLGPDLFIYKILE